MLPRRGPLREMATSHGGLGRILPGGPLGVRIRRVAADKTLTHHRRLRRRELFGA